MNPAPNIDPADQVPAPVNSGKRTISYEELVSALRTREAEIEMMPMHDSESGASAGQASAANSSVIVPEVAAALEPQAEALGAPQILTTPIVPVGEPPPATVDVQEVGETCANAHEQIVQEPAPLHHIVHLSYFQSLTEPIGKTATGSIEDLARVLRKQRQIENKKDAKLISGTLYQEGKPRGTRTALETHLLILDVDNDQRDTKDGVQAVMPVQIHAVAETLKAAGIKAFLATSFSHTHAIPRFRVIIPLLSAVPAKGWGRFAMAAIQHLGLAPFKPGMDMGALKDVAKVYFLPSCPIGGQLEFVEVDGDIFDPTQVSVAPDAGHECSRSANAPRCDTRHGISRGTATVALGPRGTDQGMVSTHAGPVPKTSILEAAAAWLETVEPSIEARFEGGNADGGKKTLVDMIELIKGWDLDVEEALDIALTAYNPRCLPPWSEADLRHKVVDAHAFLPADGNGHCIGGLRDAFVGELLMRPKVARYTWDHRGLVFWKPQPDIKGMPQPDRPMHVAPPFTLPARARDESGAGWGILLRFVDPDGHNVDVLVTAPMLDPDGSLLSRILNDRGFTESSDGSRRQLMVSYLDQARPKIRTRIRTLSRAGWHRGCYVLPNGDVVGRHEGDAVRFTGDPHGVGRTAGTLQEWQEQVARYARGNPVLAFAMCVALAGPLMDVASVAGGGGFNLLANSSKSKSTSLYAAASIWGNPQPLPSWNATAGGPEGQAVARNDGFLPLDEMGMADAKTLGQRAYLYANGQGKASLNQNRDVRATRTWRLIFLSTGEVSLEDRMSEDGRHRPTAGQEVRLVDIPLPEDGGLATLHGFVGGATLADRIVKGACKCYGVAIHAYLERLVAERETDPMGLEAKVCSYITEWRVAALKSIGDEQPDGQVIRVASRFALVAAAGRLATEWGILPWPPMFAGTATYRQFRAWAEKRGHTGAAETHQAIEIVLEALEKHGPARFESTSEFTLNPVRDRLGYRTEIKEGERSFGYDYYILPGGWREICAGLNATTVARALADVGILELGYDGKMSKSISPPGHPRGRFYVVRARGLDTYMVRSATDGIRDPFLDEVTDLEDIEPDKAE